MSQGTEED